MTAAVQASALQRVAVIGGSGFLGAHVVRQLLEDDAIEAIAIISRHPETEGLHPRVSSHAADIANEARIRELFTELQPQAVIHTACAAQASPSAALHQRVNVAGTQTLLRCAAACASVRALVYTSSASVEAPHQTRQTEDQAAVHGAGARVGPYAKTKALAEAAVRAADGPELRTAALRVPTMYGEGCKGAIKAFVRSIRKNEHAMQVGENTKVFEFCFGPKAAEAHVLAAKALLRGDEGVGGEAFYISDGVSMPFFDFARKAYALAGHPVAPEKIKVMPYGMVYTMAVASEWAYSVFTLGYKQSPLSRMEIGFLNEGNNWCIDKAKKRLGYEPVADQDAALKSAMEWGLSYYK